MDHTPTRHGEAWVIVSAVSFGSMVVLIKGAVQAGVTGETAMLLRFTLASAAWWIYLLIRRQPLWPGWRLASSAFALGALLYAPNALAYYRGTARVPGTLAAMVVAAVPVIVALLAWLFLRERLRWRGWLALALTAVGGIMMAGSPEGRADPAGLVMLVAGLTFYSLYIILSKPLTTVLPPPITTVYVLTGAAAFYWVWGGLNGQIDLEFAPSGWLTLLGLVLISTILAMFAFLKGVETVGASKAAIISGLEPVVGTLLSILLLGERPSGIQIVGGMMVIAAALLVTIRKRAHQLAKPAHGTGEA